MDSLETRLRNGPPLLLDGALGTELERRGIVCDLPLWSTQALLDCPELLSDIHTAYARAGADILTANTFRTQRSTLAKVDIGERAQELTSLAVDLARKAATAVQAQPPLSLSESESEPRRIWIAGSAPPLEDCYRADLVPKEPALSAGHEQHCEALVQAGVDFILIETMCSIAEAKAAHRAARNAGAQAMVSFSILEDGTLRSGETLAEAVEALAAEQPLALLINCAPWPWISNQLTVLEQSGLPFGFYPNFGSPCADPEAPWENPLQPTDFADLLVRQARKGSILLGGCCGTTPEHIQRLSLQLSPF
jgi:S-methylmethionine-dependent homocysteine/selenocysteine methylase